MTSVTKGQCASFHSTGFPVCLCGWSWSAGTFFPPQDFPFQWEDRLQGKKCLSASSSSSTYFIHLYIRTPTLSFSNLLNAFLLTSVVYNSPPPTFIINVPMLYLQLKRNCTWHKSTQLLVHGSHIILTVLKYFSPALGK